MKSRGGYSHESPFTKPPVYVMTNREQSRLQIIELLLKSADQLKEADALWNQIGENRPGALQPMGQSLQAAVKLIQNDEMYKAHQILRDFSVVPHAQWLGSRRKNIDKFKLRKNGAKGGSVRSPVKARSSQVNGLKGGRPKGSDFIGFVYQLVDLSYSTLNPSGILSDEIKRDGYNSLNKKYLKFFRSVMKDRGRCLLKEGFVAQTRYCSCDQCSPKKGKAVADSQTPGL